MEYTPEEEERIKAIQRHLEGEEPIEVYRSIGRLIGKRARCTEPKIRIWRYLCTEPFRVHDALNLSTGESLLEDRAKGCVHQQDSILLVLKRGTYEI